MKFIFLIFLISCPTYSNACSEQSERVGSHSARIINYGSKLGCVGTYIPSSNLKKRRSLRFFKGGRIMINTLVENDHYVGARTLFILPSNENLEMKSFDGIAVQIKDTSGIHWNFDPQGNISTEEKCKLKIKSEISNSGDSTANGNQGGFFLQSCPNSIIIDTGFKKDNDPALDSDRKSQIRDGLGNSCEVKNSEIFNYKKEAGQAHLMFKNSKEFSQFLVGHPNCKNKIDVSSLISSDRGKGTSPQR